MMLKSENNKKRKVRMNKLPDEIVISILSRLTMKEFARARLVSRKWNHYWHHIQSLIFDDPVAFNKMINDSMKNRGNYYQIINKGRSDFVNWVNNVLNTHLGCIVDEFKVVFNLNGIHQHVIDSWIVWAFSKHVEKLELDFTPARFQVSRQFTEPQKYDYVLDLPMLQSCNTKFHLTSLCLKSVDVTTQAMECFLKSCGPTLEYLCIQNSDPLTSITAPPLPSLKYFKLDDCPNVKTIHFQAPKLVTFNYYSGSYPLLSLFNIENASNLSHVSIHVRGEGFFFQILRSLFKYFSHLEYLQLRWHPKSDSPVLDNFPALANLKHLKLIAAIPPKQTLDAWVPFIGACPLLQSLTLTLLGRLCQVQPKIVCHDKRPLLWLKTFEIDNYNGCSFDVDIARFVIENAPALQEVILHIAPEVEVLLLDLKAPFASAGLNLPPHVNIVVV